MNKPWNHVVEVFVQKIMRFEVQAEVKGEKFFIQDFRNELVFVQIFDVRNPAFWVYTWIFEINIFDGSDNKGSRFVWL